MKSLYCVNDPVNFADYDGLAFVNAMMADGGGSARMGGSPQTDSSPPARIKTAAARRAENRVKSAQAAADEIRLLYRQNVDKALDRAGLDTSAFGEK